MKGVLVINVATDKSASEETVPALSLSYLPSSLTSFDTVWWDNTATHYSFLFCNSVPCLLCVGLCVRERVCWGWGKQLCLKQREIVVENYAAKFRIHLSWRLHMHDSDDYLDVVGYSWASKIYAWMQPGFVFCFLMPRQPLQCLG